MSDPRSNDKFNRIIAEWCGWHSIIDDEYGPLRGCRPGEVVVPGFIFTDIPNYCVDLNEVHEAENKWCDQSGPDDAGSHRYRYAAELYRITVPIDRQPFRATARQRAEALVKVIEEGRNENQIFVCLV